MENERTFEEHLEHQLKNDPEEAMRVIDERYRQRLFRFCMKLSSSASDAADLVQDTLLNVFRFRNRYKVRSRFMTWLCSIARNRWLDTLRYRGRRIQVVSLTQLEGTGENAQDDVDVEEIVDSRDRSRLLHSAISCLSPLHRDVVRLYLKGYTMSQIADELSLPVGTVKSRLAGARRRLRELLTGMACTAA